MTTEEIFEKVKSVLCGLLEWPPDKKETINWNTTLAKDLGVNSLHLDLNQKCLHFWIEDGGLNNIDLVIDVIYSLERKFSIKILLEELLNEVNLENPKLEILNTYPFFYRRSDYQFDLWQLLSVKNVVNHIERKLRK